MEAVSSAFLRKLTLLINRIKFAVIKRTFQQETIQVYKLMKKTIKACFSGIYKKTVVLLSALLANVLALQYFNYLEQVLPLFKKAASSLNLSKKKLIQLIPLDCHTEDDLSKVDNKIVKVRKETGRHGDEFRFKLYDLTVGNKKRRFAIQYVKEPLNALKSMCLMKDSQAVTHDNLNEQVKLFQRTLFDIFNH